jgi:hypothetical protein
LGAVFILAGVGVFSYYYYYLGVYDTGAVNAVYTQPGVPYAYNGYPQYATGR